MDKIINLHILLNPVNWVVLFVIFTFWAFAAHLVEKGVSTTPDKQ